MGSEWITYSVDEIATVKSGKRLPKDESLTDKKTSYPYIRLVDVNQGKIDSSKIQYLEPKTQNKISRYIVEANDVCLAIVGHTIGMVFYVEDEWNSANLTENAARLTDISSSFNPRYIYYYLISPVGQSEIISRKVGSAQGKLPLYNIKELKIKAPDRITQDHIVDVLLSLDNKITLNRQINQTLEQMAQTLFKSWFVDFDPVIDNALDAGFFEQDLAFSDELLRRVEVRKAVRESDNFKPLSEDIRRLFPNAFEECAEPALGLGGWMPKGWMSKSISDAIFINPKVNLAKDTVAKFVDMKALPTSGYSIEEVSEKPFSGGMKFQNNDILLARITPCLENGKTGIVDFLSENEAGFGSTEFIILRGNKNIHYSYIACLARYESFRQHVIQSMVGSSGRQRVQNGCFNDYKIAVPSGEVMNRFADIVSPSFKKLTQNTNESRSLTKLRDTLLPKLISGELSLSDIKIDIPEETLI
ncbi:restriction endonuclease subunit S [Proteus mirabilis]|nr:restriction endonuclease subunit S [Proteus mirabilis]